MQNPARTDDDHTAPAPQAPRARNHIAPRPLDENDPEVTGAGPVDAVNAGGDDDDHVEEVDDADVETVDDVADAGGSGTLDNSDNDEVAP